MSLLLPDSGLLFWMLISFGAVVFILAKFGFPVIVKMVEDRDKHISDSLKAAEEAQFRIQNLEQEGKEILAKAQAEQMQILKDAGKVKDNIIAQAKEQARIETTKIVEEAQHAIAKEREEALKDIRKQVTILSMEIAEKLVRKELDNDKKQLQFIDQLLDEINTSK